MSNTDAAARTAPAVLRTAPATRRDPAMLPPLRCGRCDDRETIAGPASSRVTGHRDCRARLLRLRTALELIRLQAQLLEPAVHCAARQAERIRGRRDAAAVAPDRG